MNKPKFYISLIGFFIFQIIVLGIFNVLYKEPFFTNSNLIKSVILTTMIGIFSFRHQKKLQMKKETTTHD
ncbi:MAG: hypothetical protein ACRCVH_08920 [Vagococcus fluvialis]